MLEIIHGTHYPSISEYILNNNILEKFVEYFEEDIKIYFSKFSETEEEYFLQDFASYFTNNSAKVQNCCEALQDIFAQSWEVKFSNALSNYDEVIVIADDSTKQDKGIFVLHCKIVLTASEAYKIMLQN